MKTQKNELNIKKKERKTHNFTQHMEIQCEGRTDGGTRGEMRIGRNTTSHTSINV